MAEYISGANEAIHTMNETVTALLADQCQGSQELEYVQGNLTISQEYLNQIEYLSQCSAYYTEANDLLHNAVCFQLFTGFYIMWVCQYVISLGVFCLLVVSCIIYQYFGTYWGMVKEDLDAMVGHLEEGLLPVGGGSSSTHGESGLLSNAIFGTSDIGTGSNTNTNTGSGSVASVTLTPNNTYVNPIINYGVSTAATSPSSGLGDASVVASSPAATPSGRGIDLSPMVSPRQSEGACENGTGEGRGEL
mgnify:CR=1 FL=1